MSLSLSAVYIAAATIIGSVHAASETTNVPIVAIVGQPPLDSIKAQWPDTKMYFAASYVKWLESAGFRVTWILPSWSDDVIDHVFDRVDAIFFTGGDAGLDTGRFADVSRRLVQKVWAANDALASSKAFWGTCLGFEAFIKYTASNETAFPVPVKGTAGVNMSLLINPTCTSKGQECHLFGEATPAAVYDAFKDRQHPVAFNHHSFSVTTEGFKSDPSLTKRLRLVAYSVVNDPNAGGDEGKSIVSVVEGMNPKRYPMYAVQFHPEKPAYEIGAHSGNVFLDHSPRSTYANNYLADRLVRGAWEVMQVRATAGMPRLDDVRGAGNSTANDAGKWVDEVNPVFTNDVVAFSLCYLFN